MSPAPARRGAATAARTTRARRTYHHGDLRNALLSAGLTLLDEAGPEALTLREVSRRVGVNHRAVYSHFEDLSALLAAVAEHGYRALAAAEETALTLLPRASPERRIEAVALAYLAFALDHPSQYRIMFGSRLNEEGRFPQLEAEAGRAYDLIAREFAAGQREGRFVRRPLRETVFTFWSLAHGFASLVLVRRIKLRRQLLVPYARQLLAPFLAGL